MNITDCRRTNLAKIIKRRYRTQRAFAKAHGMQASHVNALIHGPRSFGEDLARQIEARENLRQGWLDEEIPLTDDALSVARRYMQLSVDNGKLLIAQLDLLQRSQAIGSLSLDLLAKLHSRAIDAQLMSGPGINVPGEGLSQDGNYDKPPPDRQ